MRSFITFTVVITFNVLYYIWCCNRRLLTSLTVHSGEAIRALTGIALQVLDTGGAILAWFTLTVVTICNGEYSLNILINIQYFSVDNISDLCSACWIDHTMI